MANTSRTKSAVLTAGARLAGLLAFFACGVIALWAMWTMLGAAFDSDWLQVALALMLWMAAVGAAQDAWWSATRFPSARFLRSTSRADQQHAAPVTSAPAHATIAPIEPPRQAMQPSTAVFAPEPVA
jgi:hypothetical protein